MILYALVPSANAETTYYILGDRNVVRTYTPDPVGEDKIVYVDCKKLRSQDDVLGCIIAANYAKEKQLLIKSERPRGYSLNTKHKVESEMTPLSIFNIFNFYIEIIKLYF
jgi:hypothetical protein